MTYLRGTDLPDGLPIHRAGTPRARAPLLAADGVVDDLAVVGLDGVISGVGCGHAG
jgi:hypothetical protein